MHNSFINNNYFYYKNGHNYYFYYYFYYYFRILFFPKFWFPQYYDSITFKNNTLHNVNLGRERATSVVICGLARNNETILKKNIPKIEALGNLFKSYKIVIFENDSVDDTRNLIHEWKEENPNVILLDCPEKECKLKESLMYDLGALSKSRIDKMTNFRNRYLDYVKENYSNYKYMLVMDLDLEGSISFDGLLDSLGHDDWDGICINGRCPVPGSFGFSTMAYDSLAYQAKGDNTNYQITSQTLVKKLAELNLKLSTNDLVAVNSAFNGAAIYKMSSIQNATYSNYANCEHIGFHRSMALSGCDKIFINPLWTGYSGFQGPRNFLQF